MAKIIEIAGPAGVGKTTILNNLIKSWKEELPWVLNHKLYPYEKIDPLKISNIIRHLPNLLKNGKTEIDNRLLYNVGRSSITENSAYIDAYWKSLHTNYSRDLNGFDGRFDSAAKFYNKIQKYQYIKEYVTNKYVLFDEGLYHDLGGRVPIKENALKKGFNDIENIVYLIPKPKMLILIDTDIDIIINRLMSRSKVLQVHKDKSEMELRDLTQIVKSRFDYIKNILVQNGVTVCSIDSKDDVLQNTYKINHFISQLKTTITP